MNHFSKTPVKAVVFDFFDVIHPDPQKRWLKERGFERTGGFAEASDLLDLGHIDYAEYLSRFALHGGESTEAIHAYFSSFSVDHSMVRIIRDIKRTRKTALISNAASEEIRTILYRHDLETLFDAIVVSSEVGMSKPNADIFTHTLTELGVAPEHALFIDDSEHNVRSACALGMRGIVFETSDEKFQKQLEIHLADTSVGYNTLQHPLPQMI